jgi:hypothetical protein
MSRLTSKVSCFAAATVSSLALAVMLVSALPSGAKADDTQARQILRKMSGYLASQQTLSFDYDTNLEVVTTDHQKLLLASSGKIDVGRPDKIRMTRHGGFANVELVFDGKMMTLLGKDANVYTQIQAPGTIDNLVDQLKDKLHRPLPAADLLLPDVYGELMHDVVNVKDLGSGVIAGTECDHLAFRNKDVDWQIWVAQGLRPYPCRYVITANDVDQGPQYSIQITNWQAGSDAKPADYTFNNFTAAKEVDIKTIGDVDELPQQFQMGAAK